VTTEKIDPLALALPRSVKRDHLVGRPQPTEARYIDGDSG
jgi:hypothetical protein